MNETVIFAGLLHDIGKLIMRAEGFNNNHSATGIEYLNRYKNELLKEESILDSIKYHHARQLKDANIENNHIAYIIYEADNLAASIDRRKDLEKEHDELKKKKIGKNLINHYV